MNPRGPSLPVADRGSAPPLFNGREGLDWVLVAATDEPSATAYARDRGIEPKLVLGKSELMTHPRRLREMIRAAKVDAVIVHSTDWRRQRNPQLYTVALALMPVRHRYLVDQRTGTARRVGAAALAAGVGRIPGDALQAAGSIVGAGVRLYRSKTLKSPTSRNATSTFPDGPASVLAIWPGSSDGFGGSLTHIRGILKSFRDCGVHIGLLTCFPPPQQLRTLVDEVSIIPTLPAANRLTSDTEQISADYHLTRVGLEFAEHVQPTFVYQRHSPFLLAGAEIARKRRIPLVLEWNGSELWIRNNWQTQLRVERLLDPLLAGMEREVVSRSALVTSVSSAAAEMAMEAGGRWDKTLVLPNAVDVEEVDSSLNGHHSVQKLSGGPVLGWAGSFGPWHGAAVAVEALAQLPNDVRLVLIGDGNERRACESLADSLGVGERIEWTGVPPRSTALQRLAACDVLLSPHTPSPDQPFFGSPTKVFEYMALGRPIVVSRLGQLGEIFEDRVTARLVTPGDVGELARAVMEILQSPDRGRALGEAARREVALNHTWDQRGRTILKRLGYEVQLGTPGSFNGED